MGTEADFAVNPGWRIILHELGVSAAEVLSAADLPPDFLDKLPTTLPPDRFFAFWNAIEACDTDDPLPVAIAKTLEPDVFSPPLHVAVCSKDLRQAARRVARYKVLTGPTEIVVEENTETVGLLWHWPLMIDPPAGMKLAEILFWVVVARRCTREDIKPIAITVPELPDRLSAYLTYLDAPIRRGGQTSITFRRSDAEYPFKSANEAIWKAFEPGLNADLRKASADVPLSTKVRSILLQRIPTGEVEATAIAEELAVSPRTLQRKLSTEGTNFKAILNEVREDLAKHYLKSTTLPLAEVSFLLGYDEPSSFSRAFHGWTGTTPANYRAGE